MKLLVYFLSLFLLTTSLKTQQAQLTYDLLVNGVANVHTISRSKEIKLSVKGAGAQSFGMSCQGGVLTKIGNEYLLTVTKNSSEVRISVYAIKGGKQIMLGQNALQVINKQ